ELGSVIPAPSVILARLPDQKARAIRQIAQSLNRAARASIQNDILSDTQFDNGLTAEKRQYDSSIVRATRPFGILIVYYSFHSYYCTVSCKTNEGYY
ncbi:hypothetical protein LOAG_04319, partial [Loa loa]